MTACTHHYVIGEAGRGVCKLCGRVKRFKTEVRWGRGSAKFLRQKREDREAERVAQEAL